MFTKLYAKVMSWAEHRNAPRYLAGLSFSEAAFFPVPPDFMLAPMALSRPEKAFHYALITASSSIMGGLFGYVLGYFAFDPLVMPVLTHVGYYEPFKQALNLLNQYGFWVMFIASFTPIPFKLFTIASGFSAMALAPFLLATIIGRSARFFLLAGIVRFGGKKVEPYVLKYLDRVGWVVLFLIAFALFYFNFYK